MITGGGGTTHTSTGGGGTTHTSTGGGGTPCIEKDPYGRDQHAPGSKLDAGKLRAGLMIEGFAKALIAIGEVTTYGANKYTANGWITVPEGRARYTDAMHRHLLHEAAGEECDSESGLLHAAHAAWNALARLELIVRDMRG